jgi:hypothetical protein
VQKDFSSTPYYIKGVIGQARVRPLHPCTPYGGVVDQSQFVAVANLQKFATGGGIVQIGYLTCNGCGFGSNSDRYPMWTQHDNTTGAIVRATWYHGGAALIPGDDYRMKITATTGSCGVSACWEYAIRDVTAGESYWIQDAGRTWAYSGGGSYPGGNLAWWGGENANHESQLGTSAIDPIIGLTWMEYLSTQSGAAWTVRTGLSSCIYLSLVGSTQVSTPYWFNCEIETTTYTGDTISPWTSLH